MNLLLAILKYPPDYAGDGLRLHRSMRRWIQKGALEKAYVLTSWDEASSRDVASLDGIRILRPVECTCKSKFEGRRRWFKKITVPFQSLSLIFAYFRVQRSVDVVLTAGSGWFPTVVAWLAILTGKPLVKETVLLGSDDPLSLVKNKSPRTRWFFTWPFRRADLIITISPPLERACLAFGIPKEKIWSRFNPIEIPHASEADLPHPATVTDLPIILWVGTVSERKNVCFLIQSACLLPVPARVLFVGPCPDSRYLAKLKRIQKSAPPYVEILFLKSVENQRMLAGLYSKAKIFWFASKKEGMGNVIAESLMSGTPVVTLPVMGIMKEVIPSEEDGEVVETDSPRMFARVAARWLYKKVDRGMIAERARRRFEPDKIDEGYLSYFHQIVKRHTVSRGKLWKFGWPPPEPAVTIAGLHS